MCAHIFPNEHEKSDFLGSYFLKMVHFAQIYQRMHFSIFWLGFRVIVLSIGINKELDMLEYNLSNWKRYFFRSWFRCNPFKIPFISRIILQKIQYFLTPSHAPIHHVGFFFQNICTNGGTAQNFRQTQAKIDIWHSFKGIVP